MKYVTDICLRNQAQELIKELSNYDGNKQFPMSNVEQLQELLQVFQNSVEKDIPADRQEYLSEVLKIAVEVIENSDLLRHTANGSHEYEFCPVYWEKFSLAKLTEIMNQGDPIFEFDLAMETAYESQIDEIRDHYSQDIVSEITKRLGIVYEVDDDINEVIMEELSFKLPYAHYLQQEVHVPIMLDTGDANFDYTLNRLMEPDQDHHEPWMDDRASIAWLAKQQGYTKEQLVAAMQTDESDIKDTFLLRLCEEMDYTGDGIGQLVFLTKLTVRELLALRTAMMRKQGSITITDPVCGLFDKCNGSGRMGLKISHPIEIPVSLIQSAEIDSVHTGQFGNYGIDEVFDYVEAVWRDSGMLQLEFKIPEDILHEIDWRTE